MFIDVLQQNVSSINSDQERRPIRSVASAGLTNIYNDVSLNVIPITVQISKKKKLLRLKLKVKLMVFEASNQ